jgi:hypothetical protein
VMVNDGNTDNLIVNFVYVYFENYNIEVLVNIITIVGNIFENTR